MKALSRGDGSNQTATLHFISASRISPHLRHTASTLMQGLGVSPKAVQEMLGHSQLTQTGDYTHVILSMQQQASERMDILFQKPS